MSDLKPEVSIKQIELDELRPSMVLGKDVFTSSGLLIMQKDTMLNEANCEKLISNDINNIYIKVDKFEEMPNPVKTKSPKSLEEAIERKEIKKIEQKESYKEFSKDYVEKTKVIKDTLKGIGNGHTIELEELYNLTSGIMGKIKCKSDVFTFLSVIESTDESTYTHSNNVALLCNLFGIWLGYKDEQLMNITTAGMLHDLGKTQVDQETLNKKDALTKEEFEEIKKHPSLGYKIMTPQNIPNEIKLAALMHHEKIDGTGYPLKAKEKQVHDFAKIVAICDIYDAMTANRIYRKKIVPFEVIRQFENHLFGKLDTKFLLVFLNNIAYNYIGSWVKLSDESIGEIVFINANNLSRPMVRIGQEILDLGKKQNLEVIELL